ncbi:MAG: iron-sulfur cluster assembly accessory protein [Dehalococcoidia bacterium]|nr:iron-sulfur cluster assembly accessory protein [Dehalococcoidia bacterium]
MHYPESAVASRLPERPLWSDLMADRPRQRKQRPQPEQPAPPASARLEPRITVSARAAALLQSVIDNHAEPAAGIRLAVAGRSAHGFLHSLALIEASEQPPDDAITTAGGITLFVEGRNVQYLDGVAIDLDDSEGTPRLVFVNPNPLWRDPVSKLIQQLFDDQINPQIAAHGGNVTLLNVEGDTAYIELGGGCVGCGLVDVTLKQGIEVAIKEALPEIAHVVDTTDHSAGDNPYYKPSKK